MNNDLISRSNVIEELNYLKHIGYDNSGVMKLQNMEIQRCISVIEEVPAVEERPQGDLISREALKKAIIEHRYDYVEDNFFWTKLFNIIDNAPTITPQAFYNGIIELVSKNGITSLEELLEILKRGG